MDSPDVQPEEKKRIKAKFCTLKGVVKLVLLHADSCPVMPENPTRCEEVIRRIATMAHERSQDAIGKKNNVITPG